MIREYMRKDLEKFSPYHAPLKEYDVKIDANENPFPHSQKVLNRIQEWTADKDNLTRYPDTDCNLVRAKLAEKFGLSKENFIVSVGSDQLIDIITNIFIEKYDYVLMPNPSFSMYGLYNTINHGRSIVYELDEDFKYSAKTIIDLYHEYHPKIVFICTPNNPTGSTISEEELIKILNVVKCPVVLDEAYSEFNNGSLINRLKDYRQLILLRTFSKAYGLAGLRIGYGIASKAMIDVLNIAKPPYNVSSFSQAVASFVLDDIGYYEEQRISIMENKDLLYNALTDIAAIEKVYPSNANFLLAKVKDLDVIKYLEDNKILVRSYGTEGRLGYCIRISVGTKEENEKLVELLKNFC